MSNNAEIPDQFFIHQTSNAKSKTRVRFLMSTYS